MNRSFVFMYIGKTQFLQPKNLLELGRTSGGILRIQTQGEVAP